MKIILYLLITFSGIVLARSPSDLRTLAEKTNWLQTGDANETQRLCLTYQKLHPKLVSCKVYGKTPENRNLYYLTIGDPKTHAVWVQAGIHAGEIDGKDAVFLLLREILEKKIENPLKGIHLVFIPIVNLDGHERRGKWNRPNQVGPEEMGWRTTAQNYNLNRDFMKADSPEMSALIELWHKVDPVLSLDLHVTNGAQFQPEVGLIIVPNTNHGSTPLHRFGNAFEKELLDKLSAKGHLPLPYYPSFVKDDDPLSGFSRYVPLGRFAHGYWNNNNRLGMLVETHSWKDYERRVMTHYQTVLSSLEIAQAQAPEWKKESKALDAQVVSGKVDLEFKHTNIPVMIDFPGYRYSIEKSMISGDKVIKYDPAQPMVWKLPLYNELEASLSVEAPKEGYYVPESEKSWVIEKLKTHNISFNVMKKDTPMVAKVFRATKKTFSTESFEGRQTLKVEGDWKEEKVMVPKGSLLIDIRQAKSKMITQLFEPKAQDSFLAWGFFNRAFEQKEYMENYVAEDVAQEMLKDPKIKEEFESRLKTDAEFAKSPEQRFEFFYRKHPSWDDRLDRYPVVKN